MIADPFAYACPTSLDEAIHALAKPRAAALAGGTWLVPDMGRAEQRPSSVVDLRHLGLRGARIEGGAILLGACTTYEDLRACALVRSSLPLLALMAAGITGGRGITGQGTIGGSACYANPASDVPGCLLALGARLRLVSIAGVRDVPAASFFLGPFHTARRPDELLSAFVFERPRVTAVAGYHKLKHSGSSWPIVTASCCLERRDGLHASIAIGAAGPVPIGVTAMLPPDDSRAFDHLAKRAVEALAVGWDDALADAEYRLAVAPEVVRRATAAALEALHG